MIRRHLSLLNVRILSRQEKAGVRLNLDPEMTVIKGPNTTGKSSLIKTILWCFGSETNNMAQEWPLDKISVLVEFLCEDKRYFVFRTKGMFGLFNGDGGLIDKASKVSGFDKIFAKVIGFQLQVTTKSDDTVGAPASFLFAPSYIDQDEGWKDPVLQFKGLGRFKAAKKTILEYHTGQKSNKFYQIKSQIDAARIELSEPAGEEKVLLRVIERVEEARESGHFTYDIEWFKEETDRLINECEDLAKREQQYRIKASELEHQRSSLRGQKDVATRIARELRGLYDYALEESKSGDGLECPTCGEIHTNDFPSRYKMLQDEDHCIDIVAEIDDQLKKNERDLKLAKEEIDLTSQSIENIRSILSTKKQHVTFEDIIQSEGAKTSLETLRADLRMVREKLDRINAEIGSLERELNQVDDKKLRKKIMEKYRDLLHGNALSLSVPDFGNAKIDLPIKNTGSELPRAILAYFYAINKTMLQYGDAVLPPVIIDSPNQQDQDDDNLADILKFIAQNRLEGRQTVLAMVKDYGVEFGGTSIVFEGKKSLLDIDQYVEVSDFINPFENLVLLE